MTYRSVLHGEGERVTLDTNLAREASPPTNEDLIADLDLVRQLAQHRFPLPHNTNLDPQLCFALGVIAGTALKAIGDYQERESGKA